jgi:hypothetical protein
MRKLLLVVLLLPLTVHADGVRTKALKGLKGVSVAVEEVPPALAELRVKRDGLRKYAEIKLRGMSLNILNDFDGIGEPYFYVQLSAAKIGSEAYVVTAQFALREFCRTLREESTPVPCATWNTAFTLTAPPSTIDRSLIELLNQGFAQFRSDLLEARGR